MLESQESMWRLSSQAEREMMLKTEREGNNNNRHSQIDVKSERGRDERGIESGQIMSDGNPDRTDCWKFVPAQWHPAKRLKQSSRPPLVLSHPPCRLSLLPCSLGKKCTKDPELHNRIWILAALQMSVAKRERGRVNWS